MDERQVVAELKKYIIAGLQETKWFGCNVHSVGMSV